jgi:serine protease Do
MKRITLSMLTLFLGLSIFSSVLAQNVALSSFEGFRMEDAVINVANTTGKAVVSISTEQKIKFKGRRYYFKSPFGEEDPFRRFFDEFLGQLPEREYRQMGLGSGVIIDPEGYILTNEHVVSEADKITITLSDGREFKGEIRGKDARSDLAIIKINAHNLPVATLGDSDILKIGQWVVAIGNPFGFAMRNPEPTVTVGVVSALHRALGRSFWLERDYNDLIQTDAAINPGNSGGPLVNLKGEVVGINVAIFSTTGGYQGVGFAIPVNQAKKIISRLIEGKKIVYGWLGVTIQDLTEDLARYFGLADKNGVLVARVLEKSPAEKAGIKESDIIKQFDHKPINNIRDLLNIVGQTEVGKRVKVVILRDKKELTLSVEVGERPEDLEELSKKVEDKVAQNWRGLEVEEITSENRQHFRIEEKKGVVIVGIEPDSPADDTDLIMGDVILEINKQPIKNIADYKKVTKELKGDALIRTARGYFLVKESGG